MAGNEESNTESDLALVRQLQVGENGALDELMARYREPLHRFIHRHVHDRETARDLLQETFVRAYFAIGRFRPRAKFSTWLYTIAIRLCCDHVRSRAHRQRDVTESIEEKVEHGWLAPDDPRRDPAELAATSEELLRLEKAIQALPSDLRDALILFALEGFPQRDCAELLGISAKAVETRVYRARKILAVAMKKV